MAETLILSRTEIEALVSPRQALEPMRDAFRLYSTQRTVPALRVPSPLPAPAPSDAGAMILVPGVVAGIPAYTVKVHAKHPGPRSGHSGGHHSFQPGNRGDPRNIGVGLPHRAANGPCRRDWR
jgi:ornithine cyclodeaminase/alanine dehydrogenase-like protein (mu-crystallin family)